MVSTTRVETPSSSREKKTRPNNTMLHEISSDNDIRQLVSQLTDTILNKFETKQKKSTQTLQEHLQQCQDSFHERLQQHSHHVMKERKHGGSTMITTEVLPSDRALREMELLHHQFVANMKEMEHITRTVQSTHSSFETELENSKKDYQRQLQSLRQDMTEDVKSIQKVITRQEDIAQLKASWTRCLED